MRNFRRDSILTRMPRQRGEVAVNQASVEAQETPVSNDIEAGRLDTTEIVAAGQVEAKSVRLRFGLKMKIFLTTGTVATLLTMIGSSLHQALRSDPNPKFEEILKAFASNPSLQYSSENGKVTSSYKIWERTQAQGDGLAYYDANLARYLDSVPLGQRGHRREIFANTTTISPEPPAINNPSNSTLREVVLAAAMIDFRSYACNILQQHWVCSNQSAPFCVYFNQAVPAATKISVVPMKDPPVISSPADERLVDFKCKGKIKVSFLGMVQ